MNPCYYRRDLGKKIDTIWARAPHTAVKHLILRSYLGAWLPKLAWTKRIIFIDGFAGPGEYIGGESGSPLIALETAITHKGDLSDCELIFMFVEADPARYKHLHTLLTDVPHSGNIKFGAVKGEFSDHLGGILDKLETDGHSMAPALIMADPFGFTGMPFDLIARAAGQPRSEFLISFMYDSITRWLKLPDHEHNFDRLFGCETWRDGIELKGDARKQFLLELYVSQLRSSGLKYVRTFEMIDDGNRTEYVLVFGTHSLDGLRAMKAAMWNADPSGKFKFSDASVSTQLTLIAQQPDFDLLKRLIVDHFAGQDVSMAQLEEFVLVETPFRERHYKMQILKPMEQAGDLEVVKSPRKRKFFYPPGTILHFPRSGS